MYLNEYIAFLNFISNTATVLNTLTKKFQSTCKRDLKKMLKKCFMKYCKLLWNGHITTCLIFQTSNENHYLPPFQ